MLCFVSLGVRKESDGFWLSVFAFVERDGLIEWMHATVLPARRLGLRSLLG